MQIFNKSVDLYTIGHRVRRVVLRTMGMLVALFTTNRAHALDISDICPKCSYYGGAICDSTYSTTYDDGQAIGTTVAACIYESNRGALYPRFNDATCVSLLKSWGMCSEHALSTTAYMLTASGLSCDSGITGSGVYVDSSTYYYNSSYTYQNYTYYCGIEMINYYADASSPMYSYACCITDSYGGSTASCCFSSGSCSYWLCGICDSGVAVSGVSLSGVLSNSNTCTADFMSYFSSGLSTGWCDGDSEIYVEGTGALLIAQACYGDTIINGGHMLDVFCGVLITSCHGDCGYYRTSALTSPITFANSGADAFCAACPSDANNSVGITGILDIYANDGTGITSCYGTPKSSTIELSDTSGTYQVTINGDCPYEE